MPRTPCAACTPPSAPTIRVRPWSRSGTWSARANRYVEETAPWALARRERDGDPAAGAVLDRVLATLAEALRLAGEALRPLLPRTGEAVLTQLGLAGPALEEGLRWGGRRPSAGWVGPRPLFPPRDGRYAQGLSAAGPARLPASEGRWDVVTAE